MSGYFDPAYFDPAYFDIDTPATGFIPRGSVASLEVPVTATASMSVPEYTSTVVVPDTATAEVE